jgi:hypothetical protein
MLGLLVAVLTFGVIAVVVSTIRAEDVPTSGYMDAPKRVPDPSPRDLHAVSGVLGKAPVPSWG